MELQIVKEEKRRYLPLLLEADESEKQIDTYLHRGTLYVAKEEGCLIGIAVVTKEEEGIELKNFAIVSKLRHQGYGKQFIQRLCTLYRGETMYVGTGDSGMTIPFYEACGFQYAYTIEHFFTEHYEEDIIENGIKLNDMIVLKKECS